MAVKTVDRGYKAVRKRVARMAKGGSVEVGILGEDAAKPHKPEDGSKASGMTIGGIGEVHELGLGNNPVRSWLRGYVVPNQDKIKEKARRIYQEVLAGRMTQEQGLELLGLSIKGGIQKRIAAGIAPQVTAATQRRKGPTKTTPLINSGQFRSSINYRVKVGAK